MRSTLVAVVIAVVATVVGTPVAASAATVVTTAPYLAARNFDPASSPVLPVALGRAVTADPADARGWALAALDADFRHDITARDRAVAATAARSPELATALRRAVAAIADVTAAVPNPLPAIVDQRTAIVVLGYGLLPNGAMRPELIGRLSTGWQQALVSPASPVVVTGGNPRHRVTEAAAMRSWLLARGLPATRVHAETRATSTVGNAVYTAQLLNQLGYSKVVLITDPDHIRRATVDFRIAGLTVAGAHTTWRDYPASLLPLLTPAQRAPLYRDVVTTLGL